MMTLWGAACLAVWLGILTAISPCPLSTNIAAISFIGKNVQKPSHVFSAGLLYIAGRVVTYIVLGFIMVASLVSMPQLSESLQYHLNRLIGPLLVLVGMALLGWLSFGVSLPGGGERIRNFFKDKGILGAFPLGVLFALSFCPTSAALFFGSLVPLALAQESKIFLPAVYGLSTGLPVLFFAMIIAFSVGKLGAHYNRLAVFEKWARRITGWIFIVVGVYLSLVYVFGIG